jgi:PAT family beta-lactamase induction signal transducer AmpG
VDLVRIQRFGPRRFWIVTAQTLMTLMLLTVMWIQPAANLKLLTMLIMIHNVFAAMQDIAIDALAVQVLPEHERGTASGFMFGASYLGQAVGGSGAIFVAGKFGFAAAIPFVCATIVAILLLVSIRLHEPPLPGEAPGNEPNTRRSFAALLGVLGRRIAKYLLDVVRGFSLSGRGPAAGVVFALLPPGAVALGLALGSTMQVDLGMDENQIARLTLATTVLSAIGCVVGGWISDRLGHRRMLALWVASTTVPALWLASRFTSAEGMTGVTLQAFTIASCAYAVAGGLIYGTSTAVFMGLTSPVVAATQFSAYMALMNFVYSYSATWQGSFAEHAGYAATLRRDAALAFVALLVLPLLTPASRELLTGRIAARRLQTFAAAFTVIAIAAFGLRVASFARGWGIGDAQWLGIAAAGALIAAGFLLAARYEAAKEKRQLATLRVEGAQA